MATLKDLSPSPVYVIAGRTHPKVLAHQGDVYRRSLERRVAAYGLEEMVVFDNTYRDLVSLNALIASASLVVLPYDSHDQATSGVLVDAIAAGRPVVATNFSHAAELLSSGAGVTVEHGDGRGLGQAIRRVLTEPDTAESMAVEAQRLAPSLDWNKVACQYRDFASELLLRTGAA
jgi:glycosyltransferase involved in cell wall biosynthesis